MAKHDAPKPDAMGDVFEKLSRAVRAVAAALVRIHPGALANETQDLVERLSREAEQALKEKE